MIIIRVLYSVLIVLFLSYSCKIRRDVSVSIDSRKDSLIELELKYSNDCLPGIVEKNTTVYKRTYPDGGYKFILKNDGDSNQVDLAYLPGFRETFYSAKKSLFIKNSRFGKVLIYNKDCSGYNRFIPFNGDHDFYYLSQAVTIKFGGKTYIYLQMNDLIPTSADVTTGLILNEKGQFCGYVSVDKSIGFKICQYYIVSH